MNYPQGSLWHKWDLHVHTPCSIVQNYGGDTEEAWNKFISDLEVLPPEFKVLGINDYIFLDGYKKVLDFKQNGRLSNIDLILPVIELRIDKFGGTNSHWNRVNLHVVFSDEIKPSYIESQFLSALTRGYKLAPEIEGIEEIEWNASPTIETLTDLGEKIIESIPETKQRDFDSPIHEGFNALNHNFDEIFQILNSNTYLKGKYFTAVGKTEWENVKWNDHTIAEKKNIVNKVDFLFTSTTNLVQFEKARNNLLESKVNHRLLDCSDAHNFSDSIQKEKIGNCKTWIKADTTFEGLRQVLFEDDRIFVGEIPTKMKVVDSNPTRFIKSIEVKKIDGCSLNEIWFDTQIELNPSMVAIIGNKGAGKSALLDILGLLGNSHVDRSKRPFLSEEKFGKKGKWDNFVASLTWQSGNTRTSSLNEEADLYDNQFVRFIPQNYFEEICNELHETSESSLFYQELNNVIFSHVPVEDRLGEPNLQELIKSKTRATNDAIESFKLDLHKRNQVIINIEHAISKSRIASLKKQIEEKELLLVAHENIKPQAIASPNAINSVSETTVLEKYSQEIESNTYNLKLANKKLVGIKTLLSNLDNFREKIKTFNEEYQRLMNELSESYGEIVEIFGESITKVIHLELDFNLIDKEEAELLDQIALVERNIINTESTIDDLRNKSIEYRENLEEEEKRYRQYLDDLSEWNHKRNEIIGDQETPDTLEYYKSELQKTETDYPDLLKELIIQRNEIVKKIFTRKSILVSEYQKLYAPVHKFIEEKSLGEELGLRFSVSIIVDRFTESFFSYISQGVAGTYCGKEAGNLEIVNRLNKYDFNQVEELLAFINDIVETLENDKRPDQYNEKRDKNKQLKQSSNLVDLYDFIFSLDYLKPRYVLNLGEKELFQLSPGEKGTLLLVFYLLVDKERIPLLIDQPEHNLDNETIYKLLVKSVKIAKENRQIIIVTHNPNLAVVCDAEQVIYASLDAHNGNKVEYLLGAIENPEINKKMIDVLEGTKPAFNKRRFKYLLDLV